MSDALVSEQEIPPVRVVGLRCEAGEGPPQVILKASGELAEQVLRGRLRAAHAAPVIRNPDLLEKLYRLPVDGHIGPELFRTVAVLIAHVLSVETKSEEGAHA
jgi:type III secretion system FlhB-like substrate exporter